MSKFQTLVLLPGDTPHEKIESAARELLVPWSEYTQLDPYPIPCKCAGLEALGKCMGVIDDYRHLMRDFIVLPKEKRPAWCDHIEPYTDALYQAATSSPHYENPKPDCQHCGGTGIEEDTYNHWHVFDSSVATWWHPSVPVELHTPDDVYPDYLFVFKLPPNAIKYARAIVTPDGLWHDPENFVEGDPTWPELVGQFSDHIAVKYTMHT